MAGRLKNEISPRILFSPLKNDAQTPIIQKDLFFCGEPDHQTMTPNHHHHHHFHSSKCRLLLFFQRIVLFSFLIFSFYLSNAFFHNTKSNNNKNNVLKMTSLSNTFPKALQPSKVTLLGYGALLSESSSRTTFPDLQNFRHVRVHGMRRVFQHPHLYLISQKLVDPSNTLKLASLSAEPNGDSSFVVAAFEVELDDEQRQKFIQREPEYQIVTAPYYPLESKDTIQDLSPLGEGVICLRFENDDIWKQTTNINDAYPIPVPSCLFSSDDNNKTAHGVWNWSKDSGLLPANMYLRHCLLAVQKVGGIAYESFLHDTYLVDRTTTLAQYLLDHSNKVMNSLPPPHLATRFDG